MVWGGGTSSAQNGAGAGASASSQLLRACLGGTQLPGRAPSAAFSRAGLGSSSADDCGRDTGLDLAFSLVLAPTKVMWGTVCASGGLPRPRRCFRGGWLPGPQGPCSPGLAAWTGPGPGPLPLGKQPTEAEGQGARAHSRGVPSPHPVAGTEFGEQLKAVPSLSDTKSHRSASPGRPSEAMWGSGTRTWTRGRKRGDSGCGGEMAR